MESTSDVAKRLWVLCSVLRDDGITYHEYVSELTPILFLYLAKVLGAEEAIDPRYRWETLIDLSPEEVLDAYREALKQLGESPDNAIKSIFTDSRTDIRSGSSLLRIMGGIDSIDWSGAHSNSIGDVYESLIEKNAQESRYGAGQYFTPRAVVEAMVSVTKPQKNDIVYDPAAGTAGFLINAGLYARKHDQRQCELSGIELVPSVQKMAQMNMYLHDLKGNIRTEDSLSVDALRNQVTLCLTNPPFGVKAGLSNEQLRLLDFPTNNKQLAFLQHAYQSLRPNGRAGVVVPDNVLFESGQASSVRRQLLNQYNLHTILRLPTGIFYATGIRTSALFFNRDGETRDIWVYDPRSINETFTKKRQITPAHLNDFISAYGEDPGGCARREETAHFRKFSRAELDTSSDRLDFHIGGNQISQGSPVARLEVMAEALQQAAAALNELQQLLGGSARQ